MCKIKALVDLSQGYIKAIKQYSSLSKLQSHIEERKRFFEDFGQSRNSEVAKTLSSHHNITLNHETLTEKCVLKILIFAPNFDAMLSNLHKLGASEPSIKFELISKTVYEGTVDFLLFFRKGFFEHFKIPQIHSQFSPKVNDESAKGNFRGSDLRPNTFVRVMILSPFLVNNKLNSLIKLLMRQSGLLILETARVKFDDRFKFIFKGFEGNPLLHGLLVKNFVHKEIELVLYQGFSGYESFIDELLDAVLDIPVEISFGMINDLNKVNKSLWENSASKATHSNPFCNFHLKVIKLDAFLKHKFLEQPSVRYANSAFKAAYFEYLSFELMYRYFGLLYMNFEWTENFRDIFDRRSESAYLLIKPPIFQTVDPCISMLKWLK